MLSGSAVPALCDAVDCSLPGSPVHGVLQARVLEWFAASFSTSDMVGCVCPVTQLCPTLCSPTDCAPRPPLSMEFSRQEYWSGLPFPTPGDLPSSGMEPTSLVSLALAGIFFTTGATWEPKHCNSSQIQTPFWLLGSLCITGLLHTSPCYHSHTYVPPSICLPSPLFTQLSLTIHTPTVPPINIPPLPIIHTICPHHSHVSHYSHTFPTIHTLPNQILQIPIQCISTG